MKIAILGAGSIGCFIGGAWAAAGIPVSFVGREPTATLTLRSGRIDVDGTIPASVPLDRGILAGPLVLG